MEKGGKKKKEKQKGSRLNVVQGLHGQTLSGRGTCTCESKPVEIRLTRIRNCENKVLQGRLVLTLGKLIRKSDSCVKEKKKHSELERNLLTASLSKKRKGLSSDCTLGPSGALQKRTIHFRETWEEGGRNHHQRVRNERGKTPEKGV